MSEQKLSVGQAIDQIVKALESFDNHERSTILATVCSLLKMSGTGTPIISSAAGDLSLGGSIPEVARRPSPSAHGIEPGIDIKTLKIQRQPSSAREMACLVGYYLAELAPEAERKKAINAADIEKYFKQAGYKLPTALEQVLPDAKKGGYFDSEARGEYKLNRVGHNAVVHKCPSGDFASLASRLLMGVEGVESVVIRYFAPIRFRGAPCGLPKTAPATTATGCAIRVT